MSLAITERRVGGVAVLDLNGRLTLGPGCDALEKALQDLLGAGTRAILLNCGSVSVIDSQGIKTLVRATTKLREQGGALKLCAMTPRVREVLQITRLLEVFESFPNEAEALASFPPGPGAR